MSIRPRSCCWFYSWSSWAKSYASPAPESDPGLELKRCFVAGIYGRLNKRYDLKTPSDLKANHIKPVGCKLAIKTKYLPFQYT